MSRHLGVRAPPEKLTVPKPLTSESQQGGLLIPQHWLHFYTEHIQHIYSDQCMVQPLPS